MAHDVVLDCDEGFSTGQPLQQKLYGRGRYMLPRPWMPPGCHPRQCIEASEAPSHTLACTWLDEDFCVLLLDSAPCLILKLAVPCNMSGVKRSSKRCPALRKTAVVDMCKRSLAMAKKQEALRGVGGMT
jgi:hypothetical protein